MDIDPRRCLEDAASLRLVCEVLSRCGRCAQGKFLRVERGGAVLSISEGAFTGGEDIRVWFSMEGRQYTFEASVIRVGVPIPDRTQDGLLIGFIDRWSTVDESANKADGHVIEVLPPNGPAISLRRHPIRMLDITVLGLSFAAPLDFNLVFVEQGTMSMRLGLSNTPTEEVSCRVSTLARGDDHLLYHVQFEAVPDPDLHRVIVEGLSR